MAKRSVLMIAPLALFAGLAALFYASLHRDDPEVLPSALAGHPAPAVAVEPLGDRPVLTEAALRRDEVKLVNYWASWCAPCRAEHPNLTQLADEGVILHGVNYKDTADTALAFLEELGDPYTSIGTDARGRMALDWGVYGVPETYVIDRNGHIVLRFAGPVTQRALQERIRPAIEAAR